MKVVFSSLFKSDLLEAQARYSAISQKLGDDFHERVKEAIRTVMMRYGGDHVGPHLQHAGGLSDTAAGRRTYVEYLGWLAEDEPGRKALNFDRMSKGWVIGGRSFKKELMAKHRSVATA